MTMALGLAGLAGLAGFAQDENSVPARRPGWVSDKGFWVVESNVKSPEQSTIYFYSNAGELVYSEQVAQPLKLHKRKTLMQIKCALETAVAASENKQPLNGNERLFAGAQRK